MSRSVLFCILAFAVNCGVARRMSQRSETQIETGEQFFNYFDGQENQKQCLETVSDPSDVEAMILCLCHSVNTDPKCTADGEMHDCCTQMTFAAFGTPGVMPWTCGKHGDGCEPFYTGDPERRATATKSKKEQESHVDPTDKPVERKIKDPNLPNDLIDELHEELEELELDEKTDIGDLDEKAGDSKEDQTAEDEAGEIKNCQAIEDAAERAQCICFLAKKVSEQQAKCDELSELVAKTSNPWACAVNPITQNCGPLAKVEPTPTQAPRPKDEPKPQPKDCPVKVEDSPWWREQEVYYETLFKVSEDGENTFGGKGKNLMCKFVSKNHPCLHGSYQPSKRIPIVMQVTKKKGVNLKCGFDGQWEEPTEADRQSCAYPIVPKNLERKDKNGNLIEAGDKLNRVLTTVDDKVEVRPWTGGYDLNQLFVARPDGLVMSLASREKCFSGMNPGNWLFSKTGYLEGYLWLHNCDKEGAADHDQVWWLGADLGPGVRRSQNAGACAKSNSCCSLKFAKTSTILGAQDYLVMPQVEEKVTDVVQKEYYWREDGSVEEKKSLIGLAWTEYFKKVGVRVKRGVTATPPLDKVDKRITENFDMVAENRPKVLNWYKMSKKDSMLAVLNFWKL